MGPCVDLYHAHNAMQHSTIHRIVRGREYLFLSTFFPFWQKKGQSSGSALKVIFDDIIIISVDEILYTSDRVTDIVGADTTDIGDVDTTDIDIQVLRLTLT